MDSMRYSMERFINKAKGKVAEAKGGTPSQPERRSMVVGTNSEAVEVSVPARRSRRVASSVPRSRT